MRRKIIYLVSAALVFIAINLFLFFAITRRLQNNFSGASQLKMIDVAKYLPFEEESELARTGASIHYTKDDEDLPVLDGAAALVPIYASLIDNIYPEGSVTYKGGKFSDDNYYGENFADDSKMKYQNTIRGYNAVVDGTVDLFFSAYPSKEQLESAEEKNVELEIVPIGLEAFVFFVNKKNPVDGLTVDQIRSIYRGEVTNWDQVGGPHKPLYPVTRVQGSGSQTMMEKFMKGEFHPKKTLFSIFGASIGYSFRFYLSGMVACDDVKMLEVNGVYPNAENIRNGLYPISTSFYVIYRKDNTNPKVKELVDWLLTDEGQKMIEGCGYVGLSKESK